MREITNSSLRNKILRKNILFSAILKIVGLTTSLLIVPITLDYLDKETYGIWLTLSSILYWFVFFDVGLGNGMRNYLTQAISLEDYKLGNIYLSTTLVVLAVIAIVFALLTLALLPFVNLNILFNSRAISEDVLIVSMLIAIVFTLINFVVKNIGYVFVAMQKYAVNDLLAVAGSVLALLVIWVLTLTTEGNLVYVVMAFTIIPVLVYLVACIPIFNKYPQLKPSIKNFDKNIAVQLTSKGIGFFFIQITSCLVIFGSSNIIIAHYCGPESVATYNIAYKYFYLLAIAYTVVISPMWNAYTDAYVKRDFCWIKTTFSKAIKAWGITIVVGCIMLWLSNFVYYIWIGDEIIVPLGVSAITFLYISMYNLNNCVTYLLNGLNKIRVQVFTSILFTIVYVIAAVSYGGKHGIEGIVLCMAICYGLMSLIHLYQCNLLITQKAEGIWNR